MSLSPGRGFVATTVVALVAAHVLLTAGLATVPVAAGESSYSITVDDAVDVPSRTVTFQDKEYQISAVAKADPGETVSVHVATPGEATYRLYIYNSDQEIVDSKRGTSDAEFQFTLNEYPAGSYMFVLQQDGTYKTVHPLLVRGYAVSFDAPSQATAGSTIDVTVDASKLRGTSLSAVEVGVADADSEVRVTADEQSGSTFTASIPLDNLETGSYSIHATAKGPDTAFGQKELLGLSDGASLQIETAETRTATETSDGSSGGGGLTTQTTTRTTQTTTATATSEETTTATATRTVTATRTTTVPSTPTDSNVITPNGSGKTTASKTTTGSGPGFTASVTLVGLLGAFAIWRRAQ